MDKTKCGRSYKINLPCESVKYYEILPEWLKVIDSMIRFLQKILKTYFQVLSCKKWIYLLLMRTNIEYGMILLLKNEIDVTQSHLTFSWETLVTRIGGILGVGRTLTWILNKCIDYLSFAYRNFRTRAFLNVQVLKY